MSELIKAIIDISTRTVLIKYGDNYTQAVVFEEDDEWVSTTLPDGKIVDLHYDYEDPSSFSDEEEWKEYLFQAYEYCELSKKSFYDNNLVEEIKIEKS